jgi:hypothetical protein
VTFGLLGARGNPAKEAIFHGPKVGAALFGLHPRLNGPPERGWRLGIGMGLPGLEYSERVEGKLKSHFAVQHSPGRPIQAGHSLKEAKQAIDGSSVAPTSDPNACKETRTSSERSLRLAQS